MTLNKINFTKLLLTLALVFVKFSFAQNATTIDTTNHEFRKELEVFFKQKITATELYINDISERKVRKEVENNWREFHDNFLKTIKKGYFINDSKYTTVIDSLLKTIKKANPEIEPVKILVKLGGEPNAYNFGEDIVVVYLKFIEKIENEYELAFSICHELAHQRLNHSKKRIHKEAKINNSEEIKKATREITNQKYNKGQLSSELCKKITYGNRKERRKIEAEADSLGYIFYNKAFSNQNHQAINALKSLLIIDKDKDSLVEKDYIKLFSSDKQPFKKQWINNDELDKYIYDKTPKFWQIDSLKTHPDCSDRIALLQKKFDLKTPKELPTVSKSFLELKNAARIDGIVGLHFLKEYGDSLYETLLLLKDDTSNVFLRKMAYSNLIKIQEAMSNYTLNKFLETNSPYFSNSYNTFLYFIRKLRKTELENIIEIYKS